MLDTATDSLQMDPPVADLGPLAWVFEELRKSLDVANKAIKRFVRETEQSRMDDLQAVDPASLRQARQSLHQAVGALEMVGLGAPAHVLRAMEAAVQRFVQRPQTCNEAAAAKVERASFALVEYLEAVLNNKPVQPVALFSQYREVQELAAAERVHPADLWPFDHHGLNVAAPTDRAPLECNAAIRSLFDRLVLLAVKTESPAAVQQLVKISTGLSAGAADARARTFWRVAAGFFEAVAQGMVPSDVYVKRAFSRILMQFVTLSQGKPQISETLLHDLLFFCAQPREVSSQLAPQLTAVREAFGLGLVAAVDYHVATLGRYDPAILAQARKRINAAKEAWSLYSGGDASRARQVADQFGLIGDSLLKLHPASTLLAQALVKAADHAVREPGGVSPELAMEVATTTLYLEAAFEDFDPSASELTERTQALADRLEAVLAGQPAQPLDTWMEQLYRRVSDRQTMGSVVGELKVSLGEVEKSLDQFFRTPQEKAGLHVAVSQLAQMRGVLSVLGLAQAVHAVTRMRATVEQIIDTEVDEAMAREAGTFQQLGNNLSAMSLLVDMLNYQPNLARKLFAFDEDKGELLPLMGRTAAVDLRHPPARDEARAISEGVQQVVNEVQGGINLVDLSQQLDSLAEQATLAEQSGVARAAREAAGAVVGNDAALGAQALVGLSEASLATQAHEPADDTAGEDNDEDDLLDIFLEEAREVVDNGLDAIGHLQAEPGDLEHLTTLRRAFHTLKGSSRMVGLEEFGQAAWAMEQLVNTVLAEQRPAGQPLLMLTGQAMTDFGRWVEDIAARSEGHWKAQPFKTSADAMRDQGDYLPLMHAAQAEVVPPIEAHFPQHEPSPEIPHEPPETVPVQEESAPPVLEPFAVEVIHVEPSSEESVEGELPEMDLDFGESTDGGEQSPSASAEDAVQFDAALLDFEPMPTAGEFPPPEPMLADIDFGSLAAFSATAAPAAEPLLALPESSVEVEPEPVAEAAVEPDMPDEQTRVIGSLRIGLKLYNVYLNEADEWSRRLCTGLAEWALERHEPVPEQAEALAHSLAGSSATVGFQSLSDIARALEHAIGSVSLHQRAGTAATDEQARLFVDASEDIRRLLHQFAAGFLKEPDAQLMDALYRVVHDPVPDEPTLEADIPHNEHPSVMEEPVVEEPALEELVMEEADLVVSVADAALLEDPGSAHVDDTASSFVPPMAFELPVLVETNIDFVAPHADAHRVEHAAVQDIDDDIDALDTIDIDLFPIFAEEAQELLPQLEGALRQWVARPDNGSARSEVLRNLHTLKGSARLAGALRLGEMVHRMETTAERLGSDVQRGADLEPLQSAFDAIAARFDVLRRQDPESADVVQTAPEQLVHEGPTSTPLTTGEAPQEATAVVASRGMEGLTMPVAPTALLARAGAAVRVRPELLDRLVNQAGEVMITRSRMESELTTLRGSLKDLTGNLDRLRVQLRDIELQAETQMQSRLAQARDADQSFDPLEFDRFTRVQELTRMMAESVNDVATVQRNLQRAVESTEDSLVAQGRQTRELQRDLLRTRMVEFEGISERLYRVVRQASKETGKQVRLDITGGNIEMDRGVLDRMTAAFEHLLRNSVVHGIETPEVRAAAGKSAEGQIEITLAQELNDVSVVFADDGAGLDLVRLREKAAAQGLIEAGAEISDAHAAQLVFEPGISTAREVSELAGRGIGMDVVRNDVVALGGRIETATQAGQGTNFKLVLPLTTAVTQVVMLRAGALTLGVPSNLVELVRRVSSDELNKAYATGSLIVAGEEVPFFWAGALLQSSVQSLENKARTLPVMIFRSAAQRIAMHVDEVLGNQEVVVKNLGSQLSRLPGLAGMSVLASGAVALIYNPVALATVYGEQVRSWVASRQHAATTQTQSLPDDTPALVDVSVNAVPLVLVVDDSITVRRVTQRLLQREGYRVTLAADGLQALEKLQGERPTVVLSDIEMPRMDGFDLVRNIRSDARLADLPVIMITSRIAEKHREHARDLGVDHYLGKPYSEDELLALIGHYAKASVEA
ncbi:MAG: Hpt domain-containing protein [Hydrogenophaga sp.]|uniref:hybrid sensor histidine kinase/response regulator n=1 Tax=Hydrogenophaga sp. TaxID=1904254 RepID=UPI002AB9F8DD|nr:Hpt domain-containing protein [Hydrogenophaga sp.]MDZ4102107.1 Hpt domain-containing protein [Hydrogenophaga sp.]